MLHSLIHSVVLRLLQSFVKSTFRIHLHHTKSRNRTGALYPVILVLRHLLPHSLQSFMPSLLYRYDPNHPHVHLVTAPALNFYTFAPLNDPTCSLTLKQQSQQLIDSTHESYVFQEYTPELHASLHSRTAIAMLVVSTMLSISLLHLHLYLECQFELQPVQFRQSLTYLYCIPLFTAPLTVLTTVLHPHFRLYVLNK